MKFKQLNFGCGNDIREGWDNIDLKDFDFDIFPYPIKDNTYDFVLMNAVIEHLLYPVRTLKEMVRICKDGANIEILTTYYNNYTSYTNPEHLHHFNGDSFKGLGIDGLELKKVKLISSKLGFLIPFRKFFSKYFNGLIKQIYVLYEINKLPKRILMTEEEFEKGDWEK